MFACDIIAHMKNTYKSVIALLLAAVVSPLGADAAMILSVKPLEASFKISLAGINKIKDTDTTVFGFKPEAVTNAQNIAYWKVRVSCDDRISIAANGVAGNSCGKAVQVQNASPSLFEFSMTNTTGKTAAFSLKFKAYDKNGKWLHSEEQSFQWK